MRMIGGYRPCAAGLTLLLLAGNVYSQEEKPEEVSGIGLAPGLRLQPSLNTEVFFTDNRFRSENDETSETGLRLDPSLILSYSPSVGAYKLGYRGSIDQVAEDDYEDREFFLTADLRPGTRHRFEADVRHKHDHDELGEDRRESVSGADNFDLDEWDEFSAGGQYTFGAPDARINLSARGGITDREYTTNEDGPFGTRFFDHKSWSAGGGATYRVGAKTQLVLDLEHEEFEYDTDSAPSFDSTLERALVGVRWLATAKTTGEALVGYFDQNFDSSGRKDFDGVDWRARVIWGPVTRTQFTVTTGRLLRETYLFGVSFINQRFYQLEWRQNWTSRLYSNIGASYRETDFEGTRREDDSTGFGATLFFELSRKITVKGGFNTTNRDSSLSNLDFDRNVLFQGFEFVF